MDSSIPGRERPLLAVLIDADNVPAKHAEAILKEIALIGEPALRRVYGDWSAEGLKGWAPVIRELGLVAHQDSANSHRKNATDIGLVIDAMDILHSGRFDGFVLVSSDSDFTALANRLREEGRLVVGIGERKTPKSLVNVCNQFILIENISAEVAPRTQESAQPAFELIKQAIGRIDQDDDWYHLSKVGSAVRAQHPDFDARSYGYSRLSALVSAMKGLDVRKDGTHLLIRLTP